MSGAYIQQLIDKEIYLNVISKSGTTLEPALAFRVLRKYMESRYGDEAPIKPIIHFAASSLVAESVINSKKYYHNNVVATLKLLNYVINYQVKHFIFSSTAAVYGTPNGELIHESIPTNPINPYGRTKRMIELILEDYSQAYDLQYVILRYFNAAGAHSTGEIGESHTPETHLIPIILQHLIGSREKVLIYGDDYDTPDGTCIRDYIHVTDLAVAHILALESLLNGKSKTVIYNLGNGNGYSVKKVIETCERIANLKCNFEVAARRKVDPERLVASSKKIRDELGWIAEKGLDQIIESARKWHRNQKF